jgi:hypothetical protein
MFMSPFPVPLAEAVLVLAVPLADAVLVLAVPLADAVLVSAVPLADAVLVSAVLVSAVLVSVASFASSFLVSLLLPAHEAVPAALVAKLKNDSNNITAAEHGVQRAASYVQRDMPLQAAGSRA